MRTLVYSSRYECHIGPHVFPTRKYRLVLDQLRTGAATDEFEVLEPEPATRAQLERVHTAVYLDDFWALRRTHSAT
jgi:acetoin utilization deacetylase AcuC-like enzyme